MIFFLPMKKILEINVVCRKAKNDGGMPKQPMKVTSKDKEKHRGQVLLPFLALGSV